MTRKTINTIGVFFIFLVGFIVHNLYELFPSFLTIVLAPVSESIFEHLKLILTSYVIWVIIKCYINKKNNIEDNSYLFKEFITIIFELILFIIVYYPIFKLLGENLIITLCTYFLTIIISQIFNYKIKFKKNSKYLNILSLIFIIIIYSIFTYLSYHPLICEFFLDRTNNSYGLNK